MAVTTQGAQRRTETVDVPGTLPLVAEVRDDATGNPVAGVSVTFGSLPTDSIEFPGGQHAVTVRTNASGQATTEYTPRRKGQHLVTAMTDRHGNTRFTLDCYPPESMVDLHDVGGGDLAILRTPPPVIIPPPANAMAYVLGVLGVLTLAGIVALMVYFKDREPLIVEKPLIVTNEKQTVVPPVDNQARAEVAMERQRNDTQDQRLIEEDETNWALGGAAQQALVNDDALMRDFQQHLDRDNSTHRTAPADGSGTDVCLGSRWFQHQRCIDARRRR